MPDYRLFAVIYSLIIVQERFITISRLALDDASCNLWCRFKVTAQTVPAQLRTPFGPNFFGSPVLGACPVEQTNSAVRASIKVLSQPFGLGRNNHDDAEVPVASARS